MATPSEKLAQSLEALAKLQRADGGVASRARGKRSRRALPDERNACIGWIPLDGDTSRGSQRLHERPRTRECWRRHCSLRRFHWWPRAKGTRGRALAGCAEVFLSGNRKIAP